MRGRSAVNAPAGRHSWPLIAALVLTGLSMRTAVTSVGAVLDSLQAGLHADSGTAGVITTLPVLCFAAIGTAAPRLAHRFGMHRLTIVALVLMTVGLLSRAVVGSAWLFALLSVLALTGGAIANILMPSLVKRHFPDRIGRMTAVYTTAMAVGATAGAGLTVPIGSLAPAGDGWRTGLGSWALFSLVAVLPWLPTLAGDRPDRAAAPPISARALAHSPLAWALMTCFAFQSFQAYIAFGWFAKFFDAHGVSESTAGWLLAVLAAVQIPVSVVVPNLVVRRVRPLMLVLGACYVVAYTGMLVAPVGGSWLWMALAGIGGGMFPIALTLIGMRARTANTTAALSAFVQTVGYMVAGSGPLLFGVLHGATGGWGAPMALLFAAMLISLVAGWLVSSPAYVDDELPARSVATSPA